MPVAVTVAVAAAVAVAAVGVFVAVSAERVSSLKNSRWAVAPPGTTAEEIDHGWDVWRELDNDQRRPVPRQITMTRKFTVRTSSSSCNYRGAPSGDS